MVIRHGCQFDPVITIGPGIFDKQIDEFPAQSLSLKCINYADSENWNPFIIVPKEEIPDCISIKESQIAPVESEFTAFDTPGNNLFNKEMRVTTQL